MTSLAIDLDNFGVALKSPSASRPWLTSCISGASRRTAPLTPTDSIFDLEPGIRRERFIHDLFEALDEVSEDYEEGLDEGIYRAAAMAMHFVDGLPASIPDPEPAISDSGEVSLDWRRGAGRYFSILLKAENKIAFAAYDRGERIFGSTEYYSDAIPAEVLRQLSRWLSR